MHGSSPLQAKDYNQHLRESIQPSRKRDKLPVDDTLTRNLRKALCGRQAGSERRFGVIFSELEIRLKISMATNGTDEWEEWRFKRME